MHFYLPRALHLHGSPRDATMVRGSSIINVCLLQRRGRVSSASLIAGGAVPQLVGIILACMYGMLLLYLTGQVG